MILFRRVFHCAPDKAPNRIPRRPRFLWVRLILLATITWVSLVALHACRSQAKWEGKTLTVEYAWDSGIQMLSVRDTVSDREITDPAVRARILEEAKRELPGWIELSKLRRAKGTFHIHFLPGGAVEILETKHGIEGVGSEFVEDPDTTALMLSAHEGRLDRVRDLIDGGESVNARNQQGNTALMAAGSSHQVDILRFLLDQGADINARNVDGETALTLSIFSGQVAMVNELVKRGAILDCANPTDRATLLTARQRGYKKVIRSVNRVAVNCESIH